MKHKARCRSCHPQHAVPEGLRVVQFPVLCERLHQEVGVAQHIEDSLFVEHSPFARKNSGGFHLIIGSPSRQPV